MATIEERGPPKHAPLDLYHAPRDLYLIFDDWLWGYSIRKVALSSDGHDEPGDGAIDSTERPLPDAVFRMPGPRGSPCFLAAHGMEILAMHPPWGPYVEMHPCVIKKAVLAFDVHLSGVIFRPRPKAHPSDPIYIPVGTNLLILSSDSAELLELTADPGPTDHSFRKLPDPPFFSKSVTSHAIHPDGDSIFFTVSNVGKPIPPPLPHMRKENYTAVSTSNITVSTFVLRMEKGIFRWEQHGDWMLPFNGSAYYDPELEAWVGLASHPNNGHICSCDVVSARNDVEAVLSARKISKENLFSEILDEHHVGVNLISMGSRRFCLVQCIYKHDKKTQDQNGRYLYRVTSFYLKYDKNGDLTTGNSRRVQYYRVPESTTDLLMQHPVAFWL